MGATNLLLLRGGLPPLLELLLELADDAAEAAEASSGWKVAANCRSCAAVLNSHLQLCPLSSLTTTGRLPHAFTNAAVNAELSSSTSGELEGEPGGKGEGEGEGVGEPVEEKVTEGEGAADMEVGGRWRRERDGERVESNLELLGSQHTANASAHATLQRSDGGQRHRRTARLAPPL